MTRRQKVITLLVLLLILIFVVIILIILALRGPKSEQPLPQPVPTVVESPEEIDNGGQTEIQRQQQDNRVRTSSAQAVAKTFAERYGSFSTEASFQNLRDVMPLMTVAFATETEQQIATMELGGNFYGVTTRVISLQIDQDDTTGTATASLQTQREEAFGTAQNITVKYQDIILGMILENDTWVVSSAEWQ